MTKVFWQNFLRIADSACNGCESNCTRIFLADNGGSPNIPSMNSYHIIFLQTLFMILFSKCLGYILMLL